jgi:hypothetical protein
VHKRKLQANGSVVVAKRRRRRRTEERERETDSVAEIKRCEFFFFFFYFSTFARSIFLDRSVALLSLKKILLFSLSLSKYARARMRFERREREGVLYILTRVTHD